MALTRHRCPLGRASPRLGLVSCMGRYACSFLPLPEHHQLPLLASTRRAHGKPPSHPHQPGHLQKGMTAAGEGAWPSAEGKQWGMGDAAQPGTAAQTCCLSARMNKRLLLHPGPCQRCSNPGHNLPTLLALSKGHLTKTLRAPRHPSQSHPAKLFIASCCLCTFSPPSSLMQNTASAPASLLAALQLHKTPGFLLSELLLQQIPPEPPVAASRAKAAGTHVVSRSA